MKTSGECGTCGHDPDFEKDGTELAFDGGQTRAPSLTGETDSLKATEKLGFRVQSDLTTEDRATELRDHIVEAGVDPDRLEVVSERIGVDPA